MGRNVERGGCTGTRISNYTKRGIYLKCVAYVASYKGCHESSIQIYFLLTISRVFVTLCTEYHMGQMKCSGKALAALKMPTLSSHFP